MLFPDNFGEDMSLDETCLSNGEVYTILTNKAAHGCKGALAAMVRGFGHGVGNTKESSTRAALLCADGDNGPVLSHDVDSEICISEGQAG